VNVLAIGAHPDDIELGCGATLLAHRERGDRLTLLVMTGRGRRIREQEEAADLLGAQLVWGGFEDGSVPEGKAAIDVVERALAGAPADVVYTHSPRDTHQDHRATAAASLAAARKLSRVLLYESPTCQGFAPTVYVDVAGQVEAKLDLVRAHMSQVLKNGIVDLEAIEAQARYRGFQARVRWAEAFETERLVVDLGMLHASPDRAELVLAEGA
jgi:LmbE family N-acetylglucosaminyl deacetylase